jgi:dTDP-4-dehydrorhamnose reductase
MKKIWLIGKRGMLARSLLEEMEKRGLPFLATGKEEVDVTKKDDVLSFASTNEWSHIINCSAYTAVDLAESQKEKATAINVLGVENLVAAALECKATLFHISSDYVFDGKKKTPYQEEDPTGPLSVYGETKRASELLIQESTISSVILRISWLFGKGENHFVAKMLSKMKEKSELFVVDDQRGRMTAAKDASFAILDLLSASGLFHFANKEETSWYEIASFLFEEAKKRDLPTICEKIHPIKTADYPTLAKRPLYSVLSTDKIEKYIQRPIPSWKEAILDYLEKEMR